MASYINLQTGDPAPWLHTRPDSAARFAFDTAAARSIIACYDAAEDAHVRPHRDNTTSGTAHRRFPASILLNDDYDGGELWFPEYGKRGMRPPAGGAFVFSCSLFHTVSRMTKGRRFAFLPFLYDEEAARLRESNNAKRPDAIAPCSAGGA